MAENRAIKRLLRTLENIQNQTLAFTNNTGISEIKTCSALLSDEWKEFQSLERLVKGKFDEANSDSIDKIESIHFDLKQKLIRWEKLYEETNTNVDHYSIDDLVLNQSNFLQEISSLNKRESEVRLPRVNIPIFNGKYSEFPSFRDLFEASIHNNNAIPKVHKLQYLKGLLKGDAYALINHITVTDAHYDEAWDKVKARYDKRKHVVHTLLKQFMDQPSLHQSCAKSLRYLTDVSDEVIRGLKVLGEQAEGRDPWLIYILLNKLDDDSKAAWAHETADIDFPTLERLFTFLNKRSDALESLNSIIKPKTSTSKRVSALITQSDKIMCPACPGEHYLNKCEKFLQLAVPERKQMVAEKKLCFNCLSSTHQSTVCRSRFSCRICRRRHHSTLHPETTSTNKEETSENITSSNKSEAKSYNTVVTSKSTPNEQMQAILPTAIVLVEDNFGNTHKCRALLDSGSQSSFVSENCVQRLQLRRERANISISGITNGSVTSKGKTNIMMGSLYNKDLRLEINALILNQLPSKIPSYNFDVAEINSFKNLQLADPDFQRSSPIDILIGADKFFSILESERRQFNSTILQKTVFGFIVSGETNLIKGVNSSSFMAFHIQLDIDVDKTLRQFWEIEETPRDNILSPEDEACEEIFNNTHKRQADGRYIVKLPFNSLTTKLGNSSTVATQRFLSLERKLSKERLREQYIKQMREYIEMGHMIELSETKPIYGEDRMYYLPHHPVIKESSSTTKLRVVFDGSSKSTSGVSLNEKLMVGPTIQPTLWATLLRFRGHRIAITADIEKMYRQIVVASEDTDYQRILWRENSNQRLRHYKLTRVTFGLACSAFLAIRVLQQLARDDGNENTYRHILKDFYVDDFLSGARDEQGAVKLKEDMTRILKQGGFPLAKWRSNIKSMSDVANYSTPAEICSEVNSSVSVLGLRWHPSTDILTFTVKSEKDGEITKRKIISEASRIFDPLGFLSPSIILLKLLFQKLWFLKIDWDDKLPEYYQKEYKRVRAEFHHFEEIIIQRFTNHYEDIQIHGFADASEAAYCAVVYSRITNEKGEVVVNFLTSKTKVAPIKKVSLPRLELCAANLLVKLMNSVKQTIAPTARCYAWTDSTIVLAWLSTYPARWKTFVANRTSQILDKFPRQHWAHVKSLDNPADHGTRGVYPNRLLHLDQWWCGPEWLKLPESFWPTSDASYESAKVTIEKELRKTNLHANTFTTRINEDWLGSIFQRKSSIQKIFRIVAYIRRFVANLKIKNPMDRCGGELTSKEIKEARDECVIWVQANEFSIDIHQLRHNKSVNNNSKLLPLAPFIDSAGILRVGGRLFNADCDYENKHPAIIPSNHIFTERLIRETHSKNLHAGPTLTNNILRQNYWIINGRSKIRSLLKNCVICARFAHKTSSQLMGNLPVERITPSRAFTNCGIDFAGPLYFAAKKGRGGTNPVKGYLCIFVCFSVKAIHIEPVSDFTSEAFLAALKRFTARRGVPKKIYTDNGSNFIGAKRILKEAYELVTNINDNYIISEYLSSNGIDWHFIPPVSPHFGGLWESAVKSVKTHLLKSTNNVNLTFEEMATLLCQIENILNSRPLCTTSTEDDYEVLTPAHFLIGTSTGSVPEIPVTTADSSLSRWQRVQARVQHFWKKYYTDYLHNLQQRRKWQTMKEDLRVNDIVLIKEDLTPICKWPLGKITEVHIGDDQLVRVVTVKTSSTTLQRPVVKIIKLPIG